MRFYRTSPDRCTSSLKAYKRLATAYSKTSEILLHLSTTEHLLDSRGVDAGVVGLNVRLLDLAILNDESIALRARLAEDRGALEGKVQGLRELGLRVREEANLRSRC